MTNCSTIPVLSKLSIYSGDPDTCKGFLLQCKFYFEAYPNLSKACKVTIFLTLLSGEALKWATALYSKGTELNTFELCTSGMSLIIQLMEKRSANNRKVSDHAVEFRILTAEPMEQNLLTGRISPRTE